MPARSPRRAKIHFVAVKTQTQQDLQAVQRMRAQCVKDRTALCHNIRGLLSEYGIVSNRGVREQPTRLRILWGESPHAVNCSISDG